MVERGFRSDSAVPGISGRASYLAHLRPVLGVAAGFWIGCPGKALGRDGRAAQLSGFAKNALRPNEIASLPVGS
jgi:hypothetical protein